MAASNGTIPLTISPRPQYIVNVTCTARFSDVCPDYWAYTYIEFLARAASSRGYSDGTFRPGNTATRAQLAKMIVVAPRLAGRQPGHALVHGRAHQQPVLRLHRDGQEPRRDQRLPLTARAARLPAQNNVTRGQISKMIVSAFGWAVNTAGGPHFTDVPRRRPVLQLHRDGVQPHRRLRLRRPLPPRQHVTRAQLSKILYQAMNP